MDAIVRGAVSHADKTPLALLFSRVSRCQSGRVLMVRYRQSYWLIFNIQWFLAGKLLSDLEEDLILNSAFIIIME